MAHARSGYEFQIRTSRVTLWLLCLAGVVTLLCGAGLLLLPLAAPDVMRRMAQPLLAAWLPPQVATTVLGLVVAAAGVYPLRRALLQTYDCRIGEAGIYVATLTEQQQVIPWTRFDGASARGSLAVLRYTLPDELPRQAWVAVPSGRGNEGLRLRTYLEGRTRAANARREEEQERRAADAADALAGVGATS